MRGFLQKIMICAALAVALPASAAPYYLVQKARSNGMASFYDAGSVIKDGPVVQVWIRLVINERPLPVMSHQMYRFSLHCKNQTMQILSWAKYDHGTLVDSTMKPSVVDIVIPDTFGAAVLETACHPGFPLAVPNSILVEKSDMDDGTVFNRLNGK